MGLWGAAGLWVRWAPVGKTQARRSRKRSTVAARLAVIRTANSALWDGDPEAAPSAASEPLVRVRPIAKTTSPWA